MEGKEMKEMLKGVGFCKWRRWKSKREGWMNREEMLKFVSCAGNEMGNGKVIMKSVWEWI